MAVIGNLEIINLKFLLDHIYLYSGWYKKLH